MKAPAALTIGVLLTSQALAQTPVAPSSSSSGVQSSGFSATVSPRDDFFEYVNGGWLATTVIPPDRRMDGVFRVLQDRAQSDVRRILEEAAGGATFKGAQQIGDFYTSFLNEELANQRRLAPVEAELASIDSIRTPTDLARQFARLARLGVRMPIAPAVIIDAQRPQYYALTVRQGGLGLPNREYYLERGETLERYRRAYLAFLTTLLEQAGTPNSAREASAVLKLETEIAAQQWTAVESRDRLKMYHPLESSTLAAELPGIDWDAWLTELGISRQTRVIVNHSTYVKALSAFVASTPVDEWKPYLKAALLDRYAPYLHATLVNAEFAFRSQALGGVEANQPRWARGVDLLNEQMGDTVGRIYVARHFLPAAKAQLEVLVENLRTAFRDSLNRLDWMAPETKQHAQAKLAKFRAHIGYPSKWREYEFAIRRDDLVGNVKRSSAADWDFRVQRVDTTVDPDEWNTTPQTVNAFYNAGRNSITFPAGILQPPFFDPSIDDAVNYGAIGSVIGHEMGHGFDDQGRRSDGDGMQRDWWTTLDAQAYEERVSTLVAQFDQYEALPALRVNGKLTLGENIGDFTGVTMALRAYHSSLEGRAAPVLDGRSGDQRFFIGWGQVWRTKRREDALRQQVLTNSHAPERFRTIGPLLHLDEFHSAFGTQQGDGMWLAPAKRLRLW